MMNAGRGAKRRTRVKPSSPSSASRMSHRTTSGFSRSMSAVALATSGAVPTTSTSDDPRIRVARPSARAGWSSTIARRITTMAPRACASGAWRARGVAAVRLGVRPCASWAWRSPPSRRRAPSARSSRRRRGRRQADRDRRAVADPRCGGDRAAMGRDDLARDEQPEPQTGRPLRMAQPGIGLEHDRQVLGRDAVPVVPDVDDREAARAADRDVDPARATGVLDGVRQQVQEDLLEAAGVATHDQRGRLRGQLDGRCVGEHGRDVRRGTDDRHQVDRLDHDLELARLDPADVEQPLDEVAQAACLRRGAGRVCRRLGRCRRWPVAVRRAGGSCGWRPSAS